MAVDASSLGNLKRRWENWYKAEQQEKPFTFENVNDKDVAAAIDAVRNSNGYTYFRAFTNDLNLRNKYSIVVDENSLSILRVGLLGIGPYVYDSLHTQRKRKASGRACSVRENVRVERRSR